MSPLEQLADALRRKDVELRGGNPAGLLPFDQLNTPEQTRWRSLASAARDHPVAWCACGDGIGHNATKCVNCTDALERRAGGAIRDDECTPRDRADPYAYGEVPAQ